MPNTLNSKTAIVNRGLSLIGVPAIANFNVQGNKGAALARTNYAALRDAVLEEYTWNFATRRISVAKLSTAPLYRFGNAYSLLDEVLRVVEVNDDRHADWNVEEQDDAVVLVTDLGSPIIYTAILRGEVVSLYSALFIEALAARIASEWCIPLTDNEGRAELFSKAYNAKIRIARSADSQEKTPEVIQASDWINARGPAGTGSVANVPGAAVPLGY
jgi:hypothetical protein